MVKDGPLPSSSFLFTRTSRRHNQEFNQTTDTKPLRFNLAATTYMNMELVFCPEDLEVLHGRVQCSSCS